MKPTAFIDIPEGGRFCPVFKSDRRLTAPDAQPRSALTHIYYTLNPGEVSHFHRLRSDEIWSLYQGTGLTLYLWDGTMKPPEVITLSAQSGAFCHAIPAGIWQAAEPLGDTILVGCSVAPGFEEVDFELISPRSEQANRLIAIDSTLSKFIVS
ncbi:cupin domain-containing protein [Kistimonas asteriae]|uniref:cupin domain-containing protein n=1 Tax=Kistimonas asteriae TaxID=517724 RepID=UPI001BA772C0|nr:cupin domain-containing protein [Kistimonas asteriae]